MSYRKPGWTSFLRHHGPDFLKWIEEENILLSKFDALATALYSLLHDRILTTEAGQDVWRAVPYVLARCNEQDTYEKPGAADAYAWLHLLERYVRTWLALEKLVEACCIPLARHGIRALDVGTGPGPSGFAIHDFYSAMTEFSEQTGKLKWRQPAAVTCVESSYSTNWLRHHLAEIIYARSQQKSKGVIKMCHALQDFGKILPTQERKASRKHLLWEDVYFDEVLGVEESRHSPDEANQIAQSLHRYRLITFSNFLTSKKMVKETFRSNLDVIFRDANPGTAVLVLGAKDNHYPQIYKEVDCIAEQAGFQRKIAGERISVQDSGIADRIFEEGLQFYKHLQYLAPNKNPTAPKTKRVCDYFENEIPDYPTTPQLRAYRKYRYTMQ